MLLKGVKWTVAVLLSALTIVLVEVRDDARKQSTATVSVCQLARSCGLGRRAFATPVCATDLNRARFALSCTAVAIHPNDETLATGHADGTILVWKPGE